MFTKVSIKRLTISTIAAIGFGLLSVVPSTAVVQADTLTLASAAITVANGATATVNVTQTFLGLTGDTMTVTATLVSGPVGNAVIPTLVTNPGLTVNGTTPTGSGTQAVTFSNNVSPSVYSQSTAVHTVTLTTPSVAGTYTIRLTPSRGDTLTPVATPQIWTVTVGVAAADSTSTAYKGVGVVAGTILTDPTAINVAMAVAGTAAANIAVTPLLNSVASSVALTASITGPGNVSIGTLGAAAVGKIQTESSASSALRYVNVWADGTAGTSVVTISQGSNVIATKTITFSGTPVTFAATQSFSNLQVGANGTNNSSTSNAIAVKVTDVNGNLAVNGTTVYAASANPAVATVATSLNTVGGYAYFAVQGISAGSTSILFTNQPTGTTPTVSITVTGVKVTSIVASTVTLTLDKATYAPGEKMVLTLSALDASGDGIADTGVYTNFLTAAGITTNVAIQGDVLTGVSPTFTNGQKKYNLYAPASAGTINIFATTGSSANLVTAAQALALVATATVVADTTVTDALKAQIQALQTAATKAAEDAATAAATATTNAVALATANASAQAALTAQLTALQTSNDSALALITSLTKTINKLNLKLNSKKITCTKYGKPNKIVKGLKPVCPRGYKLKK